MTKCDPNQHSNLANTECLIFHWSNRDTTLKNISEIDNTVCLLKSLFNDQMYPKLKQ